MCPKPVPCAGCWCVCCLHAPFGRCSRQQPTRSHARCSVDITNTHTHSCLLHSVAENKQAYVAYYARTHSRTRASPRAVSTEPSPAETDSADTTSDTRRLTADGWLCAVSKCPSDHAPHTRVRTCSNMKGVLLRARASRCATLGVLGLFFVVLRVFVRACLRVCRCRNLVRLAGWIRAHARRANRSGLECIPGNVRKPCGDMFGAGNIRTSLWKLESTSKPVRSTYKVKCF